MFIRVLSMSTNLGSAVCDVEFQVIDDSQPIRRVVDHLMAEVEGRYTDSSDPELIEQLERLVTA